MIEEEYVAQAVATGLGDDALFVVARPTVPPDRDVLVRLVWLEGTRVIGKSRFRLGAGIKNRLNANKEDVGEVLPTEESAESSAEEHCCQQDAESCHCCSLLSVPGGSGSW